MDGQQTQTASSTLGDVLYGSARPPVSERDWAGLVDSIAAGDQVALHALYDRASRMVFTLALRLTANPETAEELTVDVFYDVWRSASSYDAEKGTVIAWIMNRARSRCIDRLRSDGRLKRIPVNDGAPQPQPQPDPRDVAELRQQGELLRAALTTLTPDERQTIETTFFEGLTHVEAARRLNQPLGTVKTRIRSGLHKLRGALTAESPAS